MNKKRVLLIGWDAADWKVIDQLLEKGWMPTLKKFLTEGVHGNIATLDPPYSPMLWTSIATGKHAFDHGVLGFTEPLPDGSGIRPVSHTSRRVKAIWNILNQEGYRSNVVGWWPSHPAENINGVMVSNFYQHAKTKYEEEWPFLPGTTNSEEHAGMLAHLRLHPAELTSAHILPFVPEVIHLNPKDEPRLVGIVKTLAHASSVHNASTYLMEETEWDFMAVYHDAIDHWCHAAMKLRSPRPEGVDEEQFNRYQHVVDAGYRFHDMMLERLLNLVDDNTYVMILSDHGFHSDHLRPLKLPKEPAAPALEHRPYGVFALKGPGIKKGEQIFGASLLDIAPTLLQIYGLPVGRDMAGKPLLQVFSQPAEVKWIDSWESISGKDGRLKENTPGDPYAEQQALQQLIDLGYIEKPDDNRAKMVDVTIDETNFNLARSYIHAGKQREAIPVLEELLKKGDNTRYAFRLISCYMGIGEFEKAQQKLEYYKAKTDKISKLDFYEGLILLGSNKLDQAIEKFRMVSKAFPDAADIHLQMGKVFNLQGLHEKATEAYQKVLASDPGNAHAYQGYGLALLRMEKYEEALEKFFKVIELYYHFPQAHHFIGESFYYLGFYENAAEAFELSLSMAPKNNTCRKWLIKLYTEKLNQPSLAKKHEQLLPDVSKEIVVVSGLPRSGTSMMMQMLEEGGLDILTDSKREADISNPEGYYEYEPVKKLASDASWMHEAEGKALKIISQLIPFLPDRHRYKIILMEREISEIIISQQIMLGKSREEAIRNYPFRMAQTFYDQIERVNKWIREQPFIEMIIVSHRETIEDPENTARRVQTFLGREMDAKKMAAVVDKKLYRNKNIN